MPKKGQWFIIGGFLLISMIIAITVGRNQISIGPDAQPWQKYVFENLKLDSKTVMGNILLENATSENIESRLKDYSDFVRNFGNGRGINITSYFIVGLPAGGGLNITVVNFGRKKMQPLAISVNGTTQAIASLSDGSSATVAFNSVPDYFNVNYTMTEIDDSGNSETSSESANMTKRVFSSIKMRVATKDGNQVWQGVEWS